VAAHCIGGLRWAARSGSLATTRAVPMQVVAVNALALRRSRRVRSARTCVKSPQLDQDPDPSARAFAVLRSPAARRHVPDRSVRVPP